MSRTENNYQNTVAKDGGFSPRLSRKTSRRIIRYCERENISKTKFVETCVNERLDVLERESLEGMSKEMLIELLMAKEMG